MKKYEVAYEGIKIPRNGVTTNVQFLKDAKNAIVGLKKSY